MIFCWSKKKRKDNHKTSAQITGTTGTFCLVYTFCIYIQTKLNLYLSEQISLYTLYFLLANNKYTIALFLLSA